jgi:hypothetical protein
VYIKDIKFTLYVYTYRYHVFISIGLEIKNSMLINVSIVRLILQIFCVKCSYFEEMKKIEIFKLWWIIERTVTLTQTLLLTVNEEDKSVCFTVF